MFKAVFKPCLTAHNSALLLEAIPMRQEKLTTHYDVEKQDLEKILLFQASHNCQRPSAKIKCHGIEEGL